MYVDQKSVKGYLAIKDTDDKITPQGKLYIISTPIGNLEDITIRAVKTLSKVDYIAAEDTRKSAILLNHYGIEKPLISYFGYNESKRLPELLNKLKTGFSIGLITDAGTPGISDPANRLIVASLEEGIRVVAIPGPTAFLPAIIVSGFNTNRFIFMGFLPSKKGRNKEIQQLKSQNVSIILYESPHRLLKTLNSLQKILGNRDIIAARELTKKFEQIVRGKIDTLIEYFSKNHPKGEFVLVISSDNNK